MLEFLNLKKLKGTSIMEYIDKAMVWDILNDENASRVSKEERLHLFEKVINLTTFLLYPAQ